MKSTSMLHIAKRTLTTILTVQLNVEISEQQCPDYALLLFLVQPIASSSQCNLKTYIITSLVFTAETL